MADDAFPPASELSTVNVLAPGEDVSSAAPDGTGPLQALSPDPPAASVQP